MKIQPYYLVPLLVEQPTWGGSYIARFKSVSDSAITSKKIGQAFELAQESVLTEEPIARDYLYATATSINQTEQFGDSSTITLSELIASNPEQVLGSNVVAQYGAKMPLLIKFTQALSNSYQVHVKQELEFNHWLPKPESWYFFEKGKATLGLAKDASVEEYKKRCQEIHASAQQISQHIVNGEIDLATGTQQLAEYIETDHPSRFVNTIFPEADAVIDLSLGGTHHSWETDDALPNGNIVYEVQLDVKDEYCTLRSFDQGKIKDDGKIRDLTIEDYFRALDASPSANNPDAFLQPVAEKVDQSAKIKKLFTNQYYSLTSIEFKGSYTGTETNTSESGFHHLFVKEGTVTITAEDRDFPLPTGWSLFVPAATGSYQQVLEAIARVHLQAGVGASQDKNVAKVLAFNLLGKLPIVTVAEHLEGAGHVFANQLNEVAKTFSEYRVVPELNHHLMEGLQFPESSDSVLEFITCHSSLYHRQNQLRMTLTQEVIEKNNLEFVSHQLESETKIGQVFELITLGAYTAFYLAMLNNQNPVLLPNVDWFKSELSKRS